jgi:hypothetical protein
MTQRIVTVLIFVLAGIACGTGDSSPALRVASVYVGQAEPSGPPTADDISGVALATAKGEPEYGLSLQARGVDTLLFLERVLSRNQKGQPAFLIEAAVYSPRVEKGHVLVLANCRLNGQLDQNILAVARSDDKEIYKHITAAWRVDIANRAFKAVPPRIVDCINEGYGA